MIDIAKKLIGVCLLAVLVACAGTPVNPTASASDIEQKALVIVSISHDAGAAEGANAIFYLDESRYPGRVVMMSVKDILSRPVQSDFLGRRGHLYVLELEPGAHTIDGWQVASAGVRMTSDVVPLQFEIKRGEILYLGNLHAKLVLGHEMIFGNGRAARAAMPVVVDQQAEDVALAESQVPAIKGKVRIALLNLGPMTPNGKSTKRFDPVVVPRVPSK